MLRSGSGRMIISRDTSGSSVNTNPITLNFSAPIDKTNSLTTFNWQTMEPLFNLN